MKTIRTSILGAALTAVALITCAATPAIGRESEQTAIPAAPVGSLSVNPTIVQTGTKPTMKWAILHPQTLTEVAYIAPPGGLIMLDDKYVSVRPVGIKNDGTEARISINNSNYEQLFYGNRNDVRPQYALFIKKLKAGDRIDFAGRMVTNGQWSPLYTTRSKNLQVIALTHGQTLPISDPANIPQYLKPYVPGGNQVTLGALSVLIVMELDTSNRGLSGFDYAEQGLLVTFSERHPNNGHGNNLDGIDSSNPGNGAGGPNGEVDPSGGVDDEAK